MNLRLPLTGLLGIGATLNGYSENAPKPVDHTNQASSKPNVLIIYTDDMGVGDVSFLNNGWVQTPNIDLLARQGVVVTNYYTAAAVSSPSRAGLTSGIFPLELGINTFLHTRTLFIIVLGLIAFSFGTAAGVLFGKLMYVLSGGQVNPLIGSAGVSAVPMAARVSQKVGQSENPSNFLLMHAMGPNVAGVIGSAVAAGILINIFG